MLLAVLLRVPPCTKVLHSNLPLKLKREFDSEPEWSLESLLHDRVEVEPPIMVPQPDAGGQERVTKPKVFRNSCQRMDEMTLAIEELQHAVGKQAVWNRNTRNDIASLAATSTSQAAIIAALAATNASQAVINAELTSAFASLEARSKDRDACELEGKYCDILEQALLRAAVSNAAHLPDEALSYAVARFNRRKHSSSPSGSGDISREFLIISSDSPFPVERLPKKQYPNRLDEEKQHALAHGVPDLATFDEQMYLFFATDTVGSWAKELASRVRDGWGDAPYAIRQHYSDPVPSVGDLRGIFDRAMDARENCGLLDLRTWGVNVDRWFNLAIRQKVLGADGKLQVAVRE